MVHIKKVQRSGSHSHNKIHRDSNARGQARTWGRNDKKITYMGNMPWISQIKSILNDITKILMDKMEQPWLELAAMNRL